jgi:hypothetical protein
MNRREALKSLTVAAGSVLIDGDKVLEEIQKVGDEAEFNKALVEVDVLLREADKTYKKRFVTDADGRMYFHITHVLPNKRMYRTIMEYFEKSAVVQPFMEKFIQSCALNALKNTLYQERGIYDMMKKLYTRAERE